MVMDRPENRCRVAGLDLHMPHPPFPAQLAIMAKVVQAVRAPGNALLESPTGTGKTLALLTAALATQCYYRAQFEAAKAVNSAIAQVCARAKAEISHPEPSLSAGAMSDKAPASIETKIEPKITSPGNCVPLIAPPRIYFFSRTHSQLSQVVREYKKLTQYTQFDGSALQGPTRELLQELVSQVMAGPSGSGILDGLVASSLPPTVDPASALLAVAQLASPRCLQPPVMSLLASRSRTCVNSDVLSGDTKGQAPKDTKRRRKSGSGAALPAAAAARTAMTSGRAVDDGCSALLATRSCRYSLGSERLSENLPFVWDIALSTSLGRQLGGCPYFASRSLHEKADIVFAPYTYAFDPVLREAMSLELEGAVIIIDEAHNVAEECRDAASMELSRAELIVAVSSFGDMMNQGSLEHMHSAFHRVLVGILRWCDERAAMKGWLPGIGGHEARSSVSQATSTPFRGGGASSEDPQWTGRQAVDLFESWGLTRDTLAILHTYLTEVSAYRKQQLQESVASVDGTNACILSSRALSTAERLLVCSSFLLSAVDGCSDAAAHYDLVLQRSDPGESGSVTLEYDDSPASATASVSTYKICLWCMTPTLAFRDVAKLARCVILTSGTLSPLESFALELGNQFPLQLQAPHVVDLKRQLWAGVVAESMWASSVELSSVESRGASIAHAPLTFPWTVNPSQQKILRVELNGTFAHATQLQYLEGVGTAILTIAAATPNGVLCFFPSFAMLSRCIEHWKRAKLEAAPTEDLVGWTPPIFSSAQPETFRSRRSPWGKTDYGGEARTCSDGDGKPGTLWNALWRVKRIFYESSSRSAGAEDFSQLLSTFQLVVDATRSHNSAPLNHPTSSSDTCSSTAAEAVAVSASANGAGDTAAEPEETRSTVVAAREDSKNALTATVVVF